MQSGSGVLPPRDEIAALFLEDEARLISRLAQRAAFGEPERKRVADLAARLVTAARANRHEHGGVDAFMHQYALSSEEGIILMCLAEALLRIPDADTADRLIAEKIGGGRWEKHLGASDSLFVNASTFGLMLTGRVVRLGEEKGSGPAAVLKRLIARSGEPLIRQALRQAMRILGDNFVLGRTIEEALERAREYEAQGYRFSFDMLGERAKTAADAQRYLDRYMAAIEAIGQAAGLASAGEDEMMARPSVSVKLSAIHPRFDPGKERRLDAELLPRIVELAAAARRHGLPLTIDAEEQDRLDLTLGLFAGAFRDPSLEGWPGLGLAVQAYGKRALPVLEWLAQLADAEAKRIPVRLVKGAYWDSEIKWAQERGLADYPVFTRKAHTDVSFLACMRFMLARPTAFFAQFATHNAHTIASVHVAAAGAPFEFQRLHGMGEALYEEVVAEGKLGRPCRIYAPVGPHEDLVAYLVRRLLENGANTSFVNRLADDAAPVEDMVRDPVEIVAAERAKPVRLLPRPPDIYLPARRNSAGIALTEPAVREPLLEAIRTELDALLLRRRADRRWQGAGRHRASRAGAEPARPPGARRHRVDCRRGGDRGGACVCAGLRPGVGPAGRVGAGRDPGAGRRPLRARPRAADGGDGARGRQDARQRARRRARGGRLPALLRGRGAAPVRRADLAPGPDRGDQHARSCGDAAPSPASRRGTSRSPFSRARSPPRWRPAIRCLPSPPSRRRSWPFSPSSCCTRRACRAACCISCRAPVRSAPLSSRTPAWPASSSPAPTRRDGPSTPRWPRGADPSCRSSRRPAVSMP